MDLFDSAPKDPALIPLADRLRPQTLEEVVGQDHLLGPGKALRQAIDSGRIPSMIFWGPPGVGKTTLAILIARHTGASFHSISAVTTGIKEVKEVIAQARQRLKFEQRRTILFVDEIHRFNKAQQDAFLPHVENGTIVLIGATTENPSFEVISPLLSRCQVYVLQALTAADLNRILRRALQTLQLSASEEALRHLAGQAYGDARAALNALELAALMAAQDRLPEITLAVAEEALQQKALRYDREGEEHYNLISALHKSVRGSDPDAALYWLGRMLEAGEDPHYLLRRLIRMAVEDIGLADPGALAQAAAGLQAFDVVGLPEGKLILAELAVYLALAPKSNALYLAYDKVQAAVREHGDLPVPLHIRNAPTGLMRDLGYGQGYRYAHDYEGHWVADDYLPEALAGKRFYAPGPLGWEKSQAGIIEERMKLRETRRRQAGRRPEDTPGSET